MKTIPKHKLAILNITIAALLLVFAAFALSIPVRAAEADCGVVYEISSDNTYVVIIGYSEEFPKIVIPAEIDGLPVKEIAKNAFTNNYDLYSIVLPDTVTVIGEGAFRNCRSLVSVKLPSSLTQLPKDCFMHCFTLKEIILPETLTTIGDFCFEGCSRLGRLRIPPSVTEIGYDAFVQCENIYLDVSENGYAAEYAVEFNINTSYEGTSTYFWTMICIGVGIALVILFIAAIFFYRYLRKHPERNPNIFIFKVLGAVYNYLAKAFEFIGKALLWLITTALYLLTTAWKWLREKLGKHKKYKKRPSDNDPTIDERME
ncbi:MAG: leucine-rich repeat domain-containing protein [Clostridia bacterium]|nr:leucine-rich repeat domain-containing protein [Clostridia bacterium]